MKMNRHKINPEHVLVGITTLCLLGMLVSAVLLDLEYTFLPGSTENSTVFCGSGGGCRTVNDSPYARMFGLPNSVLGFVGYIVIGVLALIIRAAYKRSQTRARDVRIMGCTIRQLRLLLGSVVAAAFLFSMYLLYVQRYIIGIYCPYCIISDIIITLIALLTYLVVRS